MFFPSPGSVTIDSNLYYTVQYILKMQRSKRTIQDFSRLL